MEETREFRLLRQEYETITKCCPDKITYNFYRENIEHFKGFYNGIWVMLIYTEPSGYCDMFLQTAKGYRQKLEDFYRERINKI